MKETTPTDMLRLAESYCENGTPWHHHFFTRKCSLNNSDKFQVILENEDTGEIFVFNADQKPTKCLELLENLFFGRSK